MDIDANEFGRSGYKFLRENKVIPDKDKKDLTFKEVEDIVGKLQNMIMNAINDHQKDKNKYNFLSYLYISVICYLENTDLNKYVKMSKKP